MFGELWSCVTLSSFLISICSAHLSPPTDLKAEWIDNMTVKVSWKKPKNVPENCTILYQWTINSEPGRTTETHFLKVLLSESAAKWTYSVQTVGTSPSCLDWTSSEVKNVTEAPEPRVVVRDFKCYLSTDDFICSWTRGPSLPESLFYNFCGPNTKLIQCNITYKSERKGVCHLSGDFLQKELCMVAITPNGVSTFKAPKGLILPNMTIKEEESKLVLTWAPLAVQIDCSIYNICYSGCGNDKICQDHNLLAGPLKIPYDKSCQYKFRYRAQTTAPYCSEISSDWSEEMVHGFTDWTVTVVAIVIPVFVSACVILSCICFRRNKHILCPDVPDPSTIFKEMINGSKEIKPNVSMYTPVQEHIEPIFIVHHIPQSSGLVAT